MSDVFKNIQIDTKTVVSMAEEWYTSTTMRPVPAYGSIEWDRMFEQYMDFAFGDEAAEFDTESIQQMDY